VALGDKFPVVYVDGDVPQRPIQLGQLLVDSSLISEGNTNLQQCTSQSPLVYEPIQGGYPETPAEIAAGVTIVDYHYPPGDVRRYGTNTVPGATDMTVAVAATFAVSATYRAIFHPEIYLTGKQTPPAGANIYLPPGCVLKDKGALGTNERFLNITNDGVVITAYGARVEMDRADYPSGEQRHGVFIFGAHHTRIFGLESSDCGGDGFYIGGNTADPATDTYLLDCKADNNRRQGCSIVSASVLRLIDFQATNTNGTDPAAGIDIEPNDPADVLDDIRIVRPRCVGNDGCGILVFLANWDATSNYSDITIEDAYTEDNGSSADADQRGAGVDLRRIPTTNACQGKISLVRGTYVDEYRCGIRVLDWDAAGPFIQITDPLIINPNQENGSNSTLNGGIILYSSGSYTTTPGNVLIEGARIVDDDGNLTAVNGLTIENTGGGWTAVELADPVSPTSNPYTISSTERAVRVFNSIPPQVAQASGVTITDGRFFGRVLTNTGASGTTTQTLPAATADRVGWLYMWEVTAAHQLRIDPDGTDLIRGGTAGQYMVSSTIGDNAVLECDGAGTWKVVSRYGTWSFV